MLGVPVGVEKEFRGVPVGVVKVLAVGLLGGGSFEYSLEEEVRGDVLGEFQGDFLDPGPESYSPEVRRLPLLLAALVLGVAAGAEYLEVDG